MKMCSMVEGTYTGCLVVLEKNGLGPAAEILENYGIDSETDLLENYGIDSETEQYCNLYIYWQASNTAVHYAFISSGRGPPPDLFPLKGSRQRFFFCDSFS
jgi:hypothetical protein